MAYFCRFNCFVFYMSLILSCSLVISKACKTKQQIPSTLDGPFQPKTVQFDPGLRRGSDDLPPSDPRLTRKKPSKYPEQISLALSSPGSMWVSWITGDAQLGSVVTPLDPCSMSSTVLYGTDSGKYTFSINGSAFVYSQIYPFEGLLNYTSGIIHHVRLEGLLSRTKYFYRCGDASLDALSEEHTFETLPSPSPISYPDRIAVVGDLGLTYNSSSTMQHLLQNNPSLLLMVGDLSYADQYITNGTGSSCFSCAFPDAPIRETYQPHWDEWGRFLEPVTSNLPMMVIEGNHEIEPQINNVTFLSYQTRFAVPSEESGSKSSLYYSFDAGGIHFVMLGGYVDYNNTSAQYSWLKQDLAKVDRSKTPWLIAAWHPPWYNSYSSHYREVECMRLEMEDLLYAYGVDVVFSGHVHAYERMNRVYNYNLDPCGPVYITVGDGGNIEQIDVTHADDPNGCPKPTDNRPQFGNLCIFNFSSGPAKSKFCWDRQPEWSAFRDSSFGHGILEVKNSTHALWTWHRNQDVYGEESFGDAVIIVRQPESCMARDYK
ncbi:hypothetical protein O6H91_01G109600 [Diphasiastrum complanatum]|nr:hypothetical protein O6H91_01G109600 [Diphasiastrum complanatum]KAJ7570191.1 hypothetical protein O6H91_01G109600 [Diphasiastrum complanatum]KAJ7570192.1 hypothetical protein O6H91_01G109600 [Diphasiastrum complanatum]